jgi:hypothetical protein
VITPDNDNIIGFSRCSHEYTWVLAAARLTTVKNISRLRYRIQAKVYYSDRSCNGMEDNDIWQIGLQLLNLENHCSDNATTSVYTTAEMYADVSAALGVSS